MVELTVEAQAARMDAARLRRDAQALKLNVRSSLACSQEQLGRARVSAGRAKARRVEALPSPWSELLWTQSYDVLERTLVPLPSPHA